MPLANKPLNEITKDDLQELIDNKVAEGKEYDYKLLVGNSDKDKKEFLADASSFANTIGGHLIVGMDEDQGIPTAIVGISGDIDAEKLRLENMLRDSIAPRIQGIDMKSVQIGTENVLVIRIPRSWTAPHMVTFSGSSRFFGRNSGGKYQLDVTELRSAFTLSESVTERIRNFRLDRIAKIAADETPIKLSAGAKLILHVIPMEAFSSRLDLSLLTLDKRIEWQRKFNQPIVITSQQYNLDGVLFYGTSIDAVGYGGREKYIQLFRNGTIEFTDTWLLNQPGKTIPATKYESTLLELLPIILSVQHELGFQPPVLVMLTLLGVRGHKLGELIQSGRIISHSELGIDRNELLIPDVLIDDFSNDIPQKMKFVFDVVWQACGLAQSRNYDENRNWKPFV